MYKKILILIIIIVLGIGNIYFYKQSKKLVYDINIGVPVDVEGETYGIDFYETLSDRDEANLLIFSFMSGVSIEKPKVCEELPKLTVWFSEWEKGITYRQVNMWIDNDKVIIETDVNSEMPNYRMIDGNRAEDLKKIIEKYSVTKIYK